MNTQWRDLVGSLVDGKYPLTEYLGDVGGDGVFATSPMGSQNAILRLTPAGTRDAGGLLERSRAAMAIAHPNIAATYAAGETEVLGDTFIYSVTERPDDSLAEAVRARPLSQDEAHLLTYSMLSALAYLHDQGFHHGVLRPDNIVAMGDKVKLAPWSIARATRQDQSNDIFAAGQTIAEVLTQKRPTSEAGLLQLPAPFHEVARACLRRSVTAEEALRLLAKVPDVSSEPETTKYKLSTPAIVAACLAVLALFYIVRSCKSADRAPAPPSSVTLPSPVREERPGLTAATPPVRKTRGDWVVVAEIYKQHDQATERARQIATRWRNWHPEVYPPNPKGDRFLVVLGFAESRNQGEEILARARAAGMPRNVYLTRIRR